MHLTLETERLVLRVLWEDQAHLTARFYAQNWEYLALWEPNMTSAFAELPAQRNCLHYEFNQLKQGHFVRYWYAPKEHPDQLYGSVCFQNITQFPFQNCQIGYKQDQQHQGQGYATEAASAAITHLFQDCSLHRIEALVEIHNTASLRLLDRLGFAQEGIARQIVHLRDHWQDCYRYALINPLRQE